MRLMSSCVIGSRIPSLQLIVGLLLPLREVLVSGKTPCPAGQFRNLTAFPVRCSTCSTCPINHIVRKPCNRQNDTVCGPFYEFEFFNQRQLKGSQPSAEVGPGWRRRGDERQTKDEATNGEGKQVNEHWTSGQQTTTNSPDEASTVRCGHPEWRVLCYGVVVALVIVISIALSAFALFSYCRRTNTKTFRLSSSETTSGATSAIVTDADGSTYAAAGPPPPPSSSSSSSSPSTTTTTIVVDRSVRHLEEQLYHNERRRAFLRWLFGSTAAAADRLFSSNDYLEERHRRRFLLLLDPSTSNRRPTDAVPLQPYPGMISIGRTDHDGLPPPPPPPPDATADASGDADIEDTENGNRMNRTSRSDEVQTFDPGTNHGERSLLIPG